MFLYQKKSKNPKGAHCGKCKVELPEEEMFKVTDALTIKKMKLESSTYACDNCIEEYCEE